MPTTWTIAIDWNRNGSFTDTYDDVTSRAIDARWFLGTALQTGTVDNSRWEFALMGRSEIRFESLKTPIEGAKAILSGSSLNVKIGQ